MCSTNFHWLSNIKHEKWFIRCDRLSKKIKYQILKIFNFAFMWLGNFPERNGLKSRIITQKTWVSQSNNVLTRSVFGVIIFDFNPFLAGKWPCHIKAKVKSFRNWCLIFFSDSNSNYLSQHGPQSSGSWTHLPPLASSTPNSCSMYPTLHY